MDYKIVTSSNSHTLTENIRLLIGEGWEPVGSHQVVTIHDQNRFRGTQHIDTTHETEYSQTMVRKTNITGKGFIEVDIMFNHPDDDETIKVYDVEGMREEFEYELNHLINQEQ
jgi:hypothetical protein